MRQHSTLSILAGLIVILVSSGMLSASSNSGTTGANFLKIGVGAKAIGMGEAFSAVADDASTVYWNPAGLSQLRRHEISLMHITWFEGINYQFAGYVHPTENHGNFGIGVYYLSSDEITAYDNWGRELKEKTKIYDMALGLSYSRIMRQVRGLHVGATLKLIQEKMADESASVQSFDLGALYCLNPDKPDNELKIAFVIQNIGPEIKFIKESYPLPSNLKLGASYELLNDSLILALEGNIPQDKEPYLNSGLSYLIFDFISLRTGYKFVQNKHQYEVDSGLRFGAGLNNNYISIDYAFIPYGVLGNTHRVTLTHRFGKYYGIDLIEANIQKHIKKGRRYYANKNMLDAYREFRDVLILDPVNNEAKEYINNIKANVGQIAIDKQLELIQTYLNEDKLIEAKEQLDIISSLFPDNVQIKDSISQVNLKLEEKSKQRIDSLFKQGIEFYESEKYEDAISLWENVLLLNPEHDEAMIYISLAKEEIAKIDAEKKEKEKERLIKKSNELYNRGLKFYKKGGFEKAIEMFEKSISINPEQKDSKDYLTKAKLQLAEESYNEGLSYYEKNELEESLTYLQKAVNLNPEEEKIKNLLEKVQSEYQQKQKIKAEEYNKKALVEYTSGNLNKAIKFWEKALEFDPEDTKIQNSLERAKEELEKK